MRRRLTACDAPHALIAAPAIVPGGFTSRFGHLVMAMHAATRRRARLWYPPPCVSVGDHGTPSPCDVGGWDAYVDLDQFERNMVDQSGWRPCGGLVSRKSLEDELTSWPARKCQKDKKISYMLSRQRYAEWLPTAINTTGCTTFSRKRGTGAGHGPRGHG